MTFSKGLWRIIVRFGTSPSERFKIARFADWSESYPSQDYAITMGAGGYTITFDENSKAITVTKTSRTVEITFQCQRAFTSPGQSVYAIGSTAELGFWNRANAVLLSTTSAFPTRRKVIPIEINQKVEWKCLKRLESDPNKNVVYQPGPNNIFTASSPTTVFANF